MQGIIHCPLCKGDLEIEAHCKGCEKKQFALDSAHKTIESLESSLNEQCEECTRLTNLCHDKDKENAELREKLEKAHEYTSS